MRAPVHPLQSVIGDGPLAFYLWREMRDSNPSTGARKTPARWSETRKGRTMNRIGRRAFVAGSAALLALNASLR